MKAPLGPNLVLVGFMGSGKTTVGRLLSARLGRPFVDADAEVEAAAGRSVAEIFAAEGEAGFSARERRAVAALAARPGQVIATGGGAVVDPENLRRLRGSGLLVHLQVDVETAFARVGGDTGRPLLAAADPLRRLRELYEQRQPAYAEADAAFDTTGRTPDEVAAAVERWWRDAGASDTPAAEVPVRLDGRGYTVRVGAGQLGELGRTVAALQPSGVHLVSSEPIAALYGEAAAGSLRAAGLEPGFTLVPDGEKAKSLAVAGAVYDDLVARGLDRRAVLVALGGGAIGDLTGFVAATYLRGIRFVQVPTTLEAQLDASVGGKVAINHPGGKNLIGAFHQPAAVLADPLPLRSLPPRELAAGLAEAIKHGLIADEAYLARVEASLGALRRGDARALGSVVAGSCRIKAAIVEQDERETGLRAVLNFGHTLGHAIEAATHQGRRRGSDVEPAWPWRHGEAVAVGMIAAVAISAHLGLCGATLLERVRRIVRAAGLPVKPSGLRFDDLQPFLARDKKRVEGRQRWVLLAAPGRPELLDDVPAAAVRAGLAAIGVRA